MIKYTGTLFVAILWILVTGIAATAQSTGTPATPIKIQVVVFEQGTDGTPAVQPRTISLVTNPTGKFNVDLKSAEPIFPPACDYNFVCSHCTSLQPPRVGTQLEGAVRLEPDGRFQVQLKYTVRSVGGCRAVGDLNIPVFVNKIVTNTVVVGSGEVVPLAIDGKSETLKVELTLMEAK